MATRIQEAPFDSGAEIVRLTAGRTDIGCVVSFLGLVRDFVETGGADAAVHALTLEHYPGMTERMLAEIEAEARSRWDLTETLVIHRYGRMEPGEPIVLVAVCAAHRGPAFEAAAFLMDWLKTKAPFWKLEEGDTGAQWVDARESDDAAAARWGTAGG